MAMQGRPENELLQKLERCPLFSSSFGTSLRQRINTPHWFENRFIQAIIRDSGWIEKHESLLREADIEIVENSDKIFSDLDGSDPDYDLKIFDVLAEVRLIRWARDNGYSSIKKLIPGTQPTPDFLMRKGGILIVAEAKHFRERDFLPEFIEDRLKGLVLKTRYLNKFGIFVHTTNKYDQERVNLLRTRRESEHQYRDSIREELTEKWLRMLVVSLTKQPKQEIEIVEGFFVVSRSEAPCSVGVGWGPPTRREELMLEKLGGNLMTALKQIKSFIDWNPYGEIPSRALVFLSGTSSWSMEWNDMWEALDKCRDSIIWEKVKEIHLRASELIKLPFELIVGKHREEVTGFVGQTPTKMILEYVSFHWTPD